MMSDIILVYHYDNCFSFRQYRIDSLYGDSWDLCGELSSECERYYVYEECFYQCEPHLGNGMDKYNISNKNLNMI